MIYIVYYKECIIKKEGADGNRNFKNKGYDSSVLKKGKSTEKRFIKWENFQSRGSQALYSSEV